LAILGLIALATATVWIVLFMFVKPAKDPKAVSRGRAGGSKGGPARAAALTLRSVLKSLRQSGAGPSIMARRPR
jgi:hypothetical protein